jgi:hypothetical protein
LLERLRNGAALQVPQWLGLALGAAHCVRYPHGILKWLGLVPCWQLQAALAIGWSTLWSPLPASTARHSKNVAQHAATPEQLQRCHVNQIRWQHIGKQHRTLNSIIHEPANP